MAPFYQALLIDDDPTCNFLNEHWISHAQLADHTYSYTDPDQALAFIESQYLKEPAQRNRPDLLLLDIDMGTITGFEFLDRLSVLTNVAQLPLKIFILSSSTARQDLNKAKAYPLAGYLEKPLSEEHIQRIIKIVAYSESL